MFSTMVACAVGENKNTNSNFFRYSTDAAGLKYTASNNQQFYTESLARFISLFKPTELTYLNSSYNNSIIQSNLRFHPYFKSNDLNTKNFNNNLQQNLN